jgi:hypothetical protein
MMHFVMVAFDAVGAASTGFSASAKNVSQADLGSEPSMVAALKHNKKQAGGFTRF